MSLAMRHRAKMMARQNAIETAALRAGRTVSKLDQTLHASMRPHSRAASDYEVRRAELGEDLRRLSEIQSIEAKIALKAELLPKYDAWVKGVLAAAAEAEAASQTIGQDDILVQTMIWAIDCGDADRALPRARTVIGHLMDLPSRFERTTGCMIAEEFAETALATLRDESAAPALEPLLEIEQLTAKEDMPDQVRAKLLKAIAYVILRAVDRALDADDPHQGPAGGPGGAIAAALEHMKRALQLHDKVGVKKEIEIRMRQLRDIATAQE